MAGQPLREILSRFGLDFDKKSWKSADGAISGLRGKLISLGRLALGGGGVYAFKRMADEVVRLGDDVAKTSIRLGIGTEALQELRHAAALSGVSSGQLNTGLQYLAKNAVDAANGIGEAQDSFKRLGVRFRDSNGQLRPTQDLMSDVADRISKVESGTERVNLAMRIFGRSGAQLIPMLLQGSEGLEDMRREAQELGAVMDDELIDLTVEYTDESHRMRQAFAGLRNAIFKEMLPGMLQTVRRVKEWIVANRDWLATKIVVAVQALARGISRLGEFVMFLVRGIRHAINWLDPFTQRLVFIAGIVGLLALLFGIWPVIIGAAFLALEDIVSYFEGKDSVTGRIIEWIKELYGLLVSEPFDPDESWMVLVAQAIAKAFAWVNEEVGKLADRLGGPIGDLIYGRGGVTLEKLAKLAQVSMDPFGAGEAINRRIGAAIAGPPPASSVTLNQTINPPAGTSAPEIADMSAKKAAAALVDEQNRSAMRAFAPQVSVVPAR